MRRILLIGASGHGKVCADIARLNGYTDIVFLDDDESLTGTKVGKYKVLGTTSDVEKYSTSDFFVSIGNSRFRQKKIEMLMERKLSLVTLIHPSSVIAEDVNIGPGTAVMAGTVVNFGSTVGRGVIINTGATVDHDNVIGQYSHISVGVHLAGTVEVGEHCWIGIGSVVSNNIRICENCEIGAGAVVVKDINESGTYIGVPVKKIR